MRGERGEIAHLPASYVQQHLTLAYASTVHAAQGRTVDTCHALLDEAAAREAAYVAFTRGREANFAYLVAQRDPDAHDPERLADTAPSRLAAVLGNVEADRTATVEQRVGERDVASLAYLGTIWDEVAKDTARARYTDVLAGLLAPEQLDRATAEAGWERLVRAVREAELVGHHAEALLGGAIEGRALDGAEQITDVLRWRVRMFARDRAPEQQVPAGDWTALAPPTNGRVGQLCHDLAVLAQDRQHDLGQAVLADPPTWALAQLGPPPGYGHLARQVDRGTVVGVDVIDEVAAARQGWAARAGAVAAYRKLLGIDDNVASIGAAPSREQEFHRHLWAQAAAALGPQTDTAALDYRTVADAELYAARERWAREQAFAPAYVADELQAAYELGRDYGEDAALAAARLRTLEPDDAAWEQTAQQVERSRRLAELSFERARQLEDIHHARRGWYDDAEPTRVADEAALAELGRRGLPLERDRGEQLPLFDTSAEAEQSQTEPTPEAAAERSDRAPAQAERGVELDDVDLEEEVTAPAARAAVDRGTERDLVLDRRPGEEQLSLLDVTPRLADEVGAAPLRQAHPEPEPVPTGAGAEVLAWEQRADAIDATLAEARRAAELSERMRGTPDSLDHARSAVQAAVARLAAGRDRDAAEEARREQLSGWAEQDRIQGVIRSTGIDQGPARGMGMSR